MFARQALNASKRSLAASKQGIRFQSTATPPPPPPPAENRTISNFGYVLIGAGIAAGGWYYLKGKPSFLISELPKKPAEATLKGDDQWVDLKLINIETYNHNTKRFRFALPSEDHVGGLHPASALLTKHQGSEDKKPVIRPYTPVSDEEDRGFLDLLVKKYPGGPMSTHLHGMNVNQSLSFKGPIPKYPWEANKHDHICLIAGGTGITPMYQLARGIFKNPNDKTKVTLVFGNITEEDILLKKEFSELENEYPQRFRAFYVLDKPPAEWRGNSGFVSKELLKQVLPEPKSENIKVFVCGPPGMMKAISGAKRSMKEQGEVTGILGDLGYSKEQVYKF